MTTPVSVHNVITHDHRMTHESLLTRMPILTSESPTHRLKSFRCNSCIDILKQMSIIQA